MQRLIAACVAVAVSSGALAQDIKYGAKLGMNLAKYEYTSSGVSETSDSKFGVTIGGTVDIPMGQMMCLQTGLQYAMKGGEEDGSKADINLLEIPALAKFNFANGAANAVAGLNVGFIMKAESDDGDDFKDQLKTLNLDLVLGGGGAFPVGNGKLSVGLQYELGLTDMADWDTGMGPDELKSKNLAIVVGYTF